MAGELRAGDERAVAGWARAVGALVDGALGLERELGEGTAAASGVRAVTLAASSRGYFRPDEEAALIGWFARFLSIREGLWEVLGDVRRHLPDRLEAIEGRGAWRAVVSGYLAVCTLVRIDRLLVEHLATERLIQRKLNEGDPARRLPRKQYTAVYESLTDPWQAQALLGAMRFVERNRARVEALSTDPVVGGLVLRLAEVETALDPSKRRYLDLLAGFARHALARKGAVARERAAFAVLEAGGRVVSELRDPHVEKLPASIRASLAELLRPGDVLVTRHERALTNLFLPGFWPHAALYVGTRADRERLGVELDAGRAARWDGDRCVLEALKDGVLFRPLGETLAVNAVAVIRPRLGEADLARAFARASLHEGKGYNFDFDFLRSDRLVCTEVVFRAFDGLGDIEIGLTERAGRPTLSAEDLLDLALAGRGFDPVGLFGPAPAERSLLTGPGVARALAATYRR